ncbi:hypothetical protein N7456_005151 [Penicillium angulare]|uniref:Myb-like domain-containing protein n=1 Tax=Penicillium angulare TaxID=116970 RepID=A0A9W9FXS5_9EURO|nr:hypothetical protein N7456_005151 [Penicillium angulare]
MPGRKRVSSSERERRQLVRWDPDLDILLLLTVQQSCNATGTKIPWALVAETMGPKFTEGAIIQHLSKLRLRREGDDKPVPPPLRRSVPAAGSGIRNFTKKAAAKKDDNKAEEISNEVEDDEEGSFASSEDDDPSWSQSGNKKRNLAKRVKTHKKSKGFKANTPEEDAQATGELRCVGASFLKLNGGTDAESDPDSGGGGGDDDDDDVVVDDDDETEEESEDDKVIKQEHTHRIVSLAVNPQALQRLENCGSVAHPRSAEMTPDLTDSNSQQFFSSPPPTWGTPQQQVPLSPYAPNFRMAPPPYAAGYADQSYAPVFVSHPSQFFGPQPGFASRQPAIPLQPSGMPHPGMQNTIDPSLYNEASGHGWIQGPAPPFGPHNTLRGSPVNNNSNLHWDGTLGAIETPDWHLQPQDVEGSPEFEAKEEV